MIAVKMLAVRFINTQTQTIGDCFDITGPPDSRPVTTLSPPPPPLTRGVLEDPGRIFSSTSVLSRRHPARFMLTCAHW